MITHLQCSLIQASLNPVRRFIVSLSVLIALITVPAWAAAAMVWSQQEASGINVYYSPDGEQQIRITSAGTNIAPTLFVAQNSTWLAWVDKSNRNANQLKFARLSSRSGAILEVGSLPTQHGDIYAPSISIDPSGRRAWLVWAEYNGRRENLYASFRDTKSKPSSAWRTVLQVTPDSEYSANLPMIDEALFDQVKLSWMRTSPMSSESASVRLYAADWTPQAAMQQDVSAVRIQAPRRTPSLKKTRSYDDLMKPLRPGQSLLPDEQAWINLVQNGNALMGAVHSGSGAPKRLMQAVE